MGTLIVGFSVTGADDGFADQLKRRIAGCDYVAVGGITPWVMAHLLPGILQGRAADTVILEVGTSCHRHEARSDADLILPVVRMVEQVRQAGAFPIILQLYRGGIDYRADRFCTLCYQVSARTGAPFVNLALELAVARVAEREVTRDGIHPSPWADRWYADRLAGILAATPRGRIEANPWAAEGVHTVALGEGGERFDRHGFKVQAARLAEGESLTLPCPGVQPALGLLTGPTAGELAVAGAGGSARLALWDEHAFYRRYRVRRIPEGLGPVLRLEVLPRSPEAQLLKGAWAETCEAELVHLLYCTPPADLRQRLDDFLIL